MIKGLGLINFKAYQEMNSISFKKINVFLGPNSSGKSSFIKALTILKDSLNSNDSNSPIIFNEQVGDYKSLVYGGHLNKKIAFEIKVEQSPVILKNQRSNITRSLIFLLLDSGIDFNDLQDLNSYMLKSLYRYEENPIDKFLIELKSTKNTPCMINSIKLTYKNNTEVKINSDKNSYYVEYGDKKIGIPNLFVPHKFLFRFNEDKLKLIEEEGLWGKIFDINIALESIKQELKDYFNNYSHIGPFRIIPNRIEMITNKNVNSVGYHGENLIPALLSLFRDADQDKVKLRDSITYWMKNFGIANGLEIVNQASINRYSLSIKNKYTDIKSNIVDVGTGTSQLLPFIVETIISPKNSVLVIEEPESHIHPNAQSSLADLFTEKMIEDNKTFFIETHSMYILQKLQILVAEKKISPKDIGIFYFNQAENGSNVEEFVLNGDGQFIKDFPEGFYDVAYNLSTQLMNAMWED